MRKSIILIGLFFVLAAVALVYGIQYLGNPGSLHAGPTPNIPTGPVTTIDPNSVPTVVTASNSNVTFEWKLGNPYLLKNSDGDVYLDLRVSGKAVENQDRKKMNLVLVIDRSGSMGSENKLENVKNAALQIINNMNPADRLGIVIYDDNVQTLLPSSPVENKEQIREVVSGLTPGGSTNLHGGLMQGFAEARRSFKKDYVNRIILLSDGLANAGVVDPNEIAGAARRIRDNSISVSAMGVGLDYNENLMANIADNSGGNYYYISADVNMAEIFRKEWNLMQNLVATEGVATLTLAKDVKVVDVAGFQWSQQGRDLTIQVPDIYSGQTRRILVEMNAPADATRTVKLADATFTCHEMAGRTFRVSFSPEIKVIEDKTVVAGNIDSDVNSKAAGNIASRKMEEAYRLYENGETDKAYKLSQETADELKSLGYIGNDAQVQRYEQAAQQLAPASAPALNSPKAKDFLKKQKEAERNTQQSDPQ